MTSIQILTVSALIICLVSARERRMTASLDDEDVEDDLLSCPIECDCKGFTVDCSNRGLKFVPKNIPSDARRVDLGGNNIVLVRREDFLGLNGVKILDLRMNEIVDVEDGAFQGLAHLDELILFQNRLKEIRPGMFKGLRSLKTLLLNANNITSIRKDTFAGLHNLNLLSLYDNAIETILEGTFNPLEKIQVLHLGKNPFRCDCHLKWMAEYLNKHPVETSGAKCEGPKKFQKRKLTQLDPTKFKCKETSPLEEPAATQPQAGPSVSLFSNISSSYGHLGNSLPCPDNCTCHGDVKKCGSLEMVTSAISSSSSSLLSSSSSTSSDDEDLYLDDPSEASNSYTTSDLHKLSKHLNANSNKISLLLCQKGRCIPIDDLNYECKCKNGFSGPFCEQAPTCQKEVYREYYTEDGCRSKKKLKLAECVGSCGDQCCTAVKTRERPVKMVCANGKMYTKNVEIVEKCACDRSCA